MSWMDRAACIGMDLNLFFPDPRCSPPPEVRRVCSSCPVMNECLEYGMGFDDSYGAGVFGGLSPNQRSELRRRHRSRVSA